jgi:hypothetical protein
MLYELNFETFPNDGACSPEAPACMLDRPKTKVDPTTRAQCREPYGRGGSEEGEAIESATGDPDKLDVLLFDFDIDDFALKPKHLQALDRIAAFMRDRASRRDQSDNARQIWQISLDGYASPTGSTKFNLALSQCRESQAEFRLRALLPGLENTICWHSNWHGFKYSDTSDTRLGECANRRSVRIACHRPGLPPPPKHPNDFTKDGRRFQMRLLTFRAFGDVAKILKTPIPLIAVRSSVEITSISSGRRAVFTYNGLGFFAAIPDAVSPTFAREIMEYVKDALKHGKWKLLGALKLLKGIPMSTTINITKPGKIYCFETSSEVWLKNFEGECQMWHKKPGDRFDFYFNTLQPVISTKPEMLSLTAGESVSTVIMSTGLASIDSKTTTGEAMEVCEPMTNTSENVRFASSARTQSSQKTPLDRHSLLSSHANPSIRLSHLQRPIRHP